MQETDNGLVLTLYLSRRNVEVEFAAELGRFENRRDDETIVRYIAERFPRTPINRVRVVTGSGDVVTLSYMSVMAHSTCPL